jgi:hypothetical protein
MVTSFCWAITGDVLLNAKAAAAMTAVNEVLRRNMDLIILLWDRLAVVRF